MNTLQAFKQGMKNVVDFVFFLRRRAKADAVFRVASSLAYTSLIALVPLIAIGIAIFSAFPVFDNIRSQLADFLFQNLTPSFEEEIRQYLGEIVSKSGQLGAVGVSGIAVTALMLLSTIEDSFNYIFKVTQPRRIATKITLYWTVITLGPLLLGTAFSMRGYLYTLQKFVAADGETSQIFLSYLIPPLMTIATLMLVYILVPNKKIPVLNAFAGAVVAVIGFWLLRQGFGSFVMSNSTYSTLYGALAIIPIFLIWMYLSWAVVLFGAVVTAALDEYTQNLRLKTEETQPVKTVARRRKNTKS
ncbi:MAG: YihY family inner membrane protein [Alphaproteobacteria bacterium]|nr:YihY family inner membrane protein [Alphaproteobacteria bacterium]